ncbi:hypothetical protein VTN77DRAFT_6000 [Rasamsonia byssochlamydoides]|uniref:uncharacterized protein n=1 Tax=Rasamsonia byssochlamydoides TaxID=89139 RepID=UPI003741E8CB
MSGMDVLGLNLSNPSQQKTTNAHPYTSSVASSASSSASSIFSLDCVSSQSSISSSSTNPVDVIWENEASGESQVAGRGLPNSSESTSRCSRGGIRGCAPKVADPAVPPELRKHPRRTNSSVVPSSGAPASCPRPLPSLVRQCDRKVSFVDNLVDTAAQIVETIWPLSGVALRSDSSLGCKGVLPLRTFIQETLRRSRTSYSTLQVALYYLIKIKPHVPKHDFTMEQPRDKPVARAMQCGRRMFLAALILASKYLQDRNYSARAWSKISGLNTLEINQNELMFLEAVDWKLHIPEPIYQRWTDIVLKYTPCAGTAPGGENQCWRTIIPKLTPELDTIDVEPSSPSGRLLGFEIAPIAESPASPRSSSRREGAMASQPSNEQTPTCPGNIPLTLEPTPRLECPNPTLPALPKLGLLPTPQMTPQSSAACTPAASASGACSRRPSICAAISQAQNMCMARFTLDQRPPSVFCNKSGIPDGYPSLVRRSSLARSTSSASSPESMISDISTVSSRSSRSSSISSCASGTCAPVQPRLAVTATRRCAANSLKECRKNLVIASPIDEISFGEIYSSPDTDAGATGSVPDLSNFSLDTPVDLTASAQEAAQGLCELSGAVPRSNPTPEPPRESRRCRKRGRTASEDQMLQNNVRQLMALHTVTDNGVVLPDQSVADSFLISRGLQSPLDGQLRSIKLPVPVPSRKGTGGTKRACCSTEVRRMVLDASAEADFMN